MAVRILIVDADPSVQRALGAALSQAGFEVLTSGNGPEALGIVKSNKPALLLVAASLPDVDGFAVVARLREEDVPSTHTPVILLLAEDEAESRSKALRSGADDYLIEPFHPAELMARTRSLLARYPPGDQRLQTASGTGPALRAMTPVSQKRKPARVVVFYGSKGGVGATTIAINSAVALHRQLGRSVCLIDANLQFGDHRVFLDLGFDGMSVVDLATAPAVDSDLIKHALVKHETGVELLLAPPSPEAAELVAHNALPDIIAQLSDEFDYIVVDVDRRLDEATLRIMDTAQVIYIVMTADLPCLKNVRIVLETIGHLGYSEDTVKLVLNRSNAFTGINVKNAESALKRSIDFGIVNDYRTAISSLNSGAPFMSTRPDSAIGRDILGFVKAMEKGFADHPPVSRAGR